MKKYTKIEDEKNSLNICVDCNDDCTEIYSVTYQNPMNGNYGEFNQICDNWKNQNAKEQEEWEAFLEKVENEIPEADILLETAINEKTITI